MQHEIRVTERPLRLDDFGNAWDGFFEACTLLRSVSRSVTNMMAEKLSLTATGLMVAR